MSNNTQVATQQQAPKNIALPDGYALSQEEYQQANVNTGTDSYLDAFDYKLRLTKENRLGVFHKDEEIGVYDELPNVVVLYHHEVLRLRAGAHKGLTGSYKKWPEEDQQIVAMCYDNPNSGNPGATGNFHTNGYGDYLRNQTLRKQVEYRNYLFLIIPGIVEKTKTVVATFGAVGGLRDINKQLRSKNIALSQIVCSLKVNWVENKQKDTFPQPTFELVFNNGMLFPAAPLDRYRSAILPRVQECRKYHLDYLSFSAGGGQYAPAGHAPAQQYVEHAALPPVDDGNPMNPPAEAAPAAAPTQTTPAAATPAQNPDGLL